MPLPALILSLHLLSMHDAPGFNSITPGISIRTAESGYMAGILQNSEGGTSLFAGRLLESSDKHWAIALGVITGYAAAPILPLVTPSYSSSLGSGWGYRISWLPKVNSNGANALHFNLEKGLP